MKRLDSLLPQVLPQVTGCPTSMARDAIQFIAGDFCKNSGVWDMTCTETVLARDDEVELTEVPKGTHVADVLEVWLGGTRLDPPDYMVKRDGLLLKRPPLRDTTLRCKVTLRPTRDAEELPEDILEEYGDIIAAGALAKLKAMSGQHIMWADAQGVQNALVIYNEGIYAAKTRAVRARKGGGTLFYGA